VSLDLQNTNILIAILGGLIVVGGSAVGFLRFLFGLSSQVKQMTAALEKQTGVQETMSEKLGDMKNEFSRFAGITETRLDNIERRDGYTGK
jgi:hypothetical protein